MIYRLIHLIPAARSQAQNKAGMWVRAVPYPPLKGGLLDRLRAAWAVFSNEKVLAVHWPFDGEFEQAVSRRDDGRDRSPEQPPVKPRLPEVSGTE